MLAYQASTGQPQKEVAEHFGITTNSLQTWQRRAQAPLGAPESGVASESPEAELRRLRRENRELQMRCEILKKRWASSALHPGTALIRAMKNDYPITLLCEVMECPAATITPGSVADAVSASGATPLCGPSCGSPSMPPARPVAIRG